jgi:hypothetical protein
MTTQGGMGVILKITVSAALTAVANLLDIDMPEFTKYLDEATSHGSTGGYYEARATGKRRVEPFGATLEWDSSDSTHAAIVAAFNSDDPVGMSVEDPGGDEVIAFDAHIEKIGRIGKQDQRYKARVQFHPTGQPTITGS